MESVGSYDQAIAALPPFPILGTIEPYVPRAVATDDPNLFETSFTTATTSSSSSNAFLSSSTTVPHIGLIMYRPPPNLDRFGAVMHPLRSGPIFLPATPVRQTTAVSSPLPDPTTLFMATLAARDLTTVNCGPGTEVSAARAAEPTGASSGARITRVGVRALLVGAALGAVGGSAMFL